MGVCTYSDACALQGEALRMVANRPKGPGWNVSRRYLDYAERAHAVLSRAAPGSRLRQPRDRDLGLPDANRTLGHP
jgi:hypothetical protein